jgi:hypothetical protein
MAGAGVVTTIITTPATRSKSLFVGGADMMPGGKGVPLETVHVTENGPGGVSSMTFSVDDPLLAVTVTPGMDVRFWDVTLDYPIFTGFVQTVAIRPDFGDTGRSFEVECIGIECLLDWAVTTIDMTFSTGVTQDAIVTIVSQATGFGGINYAKSSTTVNGNREFPVADTGVAIVNTVTVPAGTTVREAIRMVCDAQFGTSFGPTGLDNASRMTTIDFYSGLRSFVSNSVGLTKPDDYTTEVIVNQATGTVTEGLSYESDMGTTHIVFIKGTGVSGFVSDGSGLPGQIAYLEDTNVTTADQLKSRGNAYLSQFVSGIRGTYDQSDRDATSTTHAGGMVTVTDGRVGLSAVTLRIMTIDKRFHAVRQDWSIGFGGIEPSFVNAVRRLTRTIRS